jgi:hypothetical protein
MLGSDRNESDNIHYFLSFDEWNCNRSRHLNRRHWDTEQPHRYRLTHHLHCLSGRPSHRPHQRGIIVAFDSPNVPSWSGGITNDYMLNSNLHNEQFLLAHTTTAGTQTAILDTSPTGAYTYYAPSMVFAAWGP